ncbi:MAG TPA: ADP-ribosylation factor-like protein [Polyangiaceae bacterium]|nr:ADP-ribosylation factor-like protein [Polyangiaceae bacterium]
MGSRRHGSGQPSRKIIVSKKLGPRRLAGSVEVHMAFVNSDTHQIILRIVYDGLANTGKTTNIRQLRGSFTPLRCSEILTPEEQDGRTLYFDFLRLDGGLIAGHPVRCHLFTVPGQGRLVQRRLKLLREADAVVLVCESTEEAVTRARERLQVLREFQHVNADRSIPIVVQANKQDLPCSLSLAQIGELLGTDGSTPVLAARAQHGFGVKETLVLAVRAAADLVSELIRNKGIDCIPTRGESIDGILLDLQSSEDVGEPSSFAPGSTHEASSAAREASSGSPARSSAASRPIVSLTPHKPAAAHGPRSLGSDQRPATRSDEGLSGGRLELELEFEIAPRMREAPDAHPNPTPHTTIAEEQENRAVPAATPPWTGSPDLPASMPAVPIHTTPTQSAPTVAPHHPPWPSNTLPSGFIWPGTRGRELLALDYGRAVRRDDLVGQSGANDGSGRSDAYVYRVADFCLKTSARRRFTDGDDARALLARTARSKVSLGELLLKDTVLALVPSDGTFWLWTLTPWCQTLRSRMNAASAGEDENALGQALIEYSNAALTSLELARTRELVLDVHPSNFATTEQGLVYLDDDVESGSVLMPIAHALLQRVTEYMRHPHAIAAYVGKLVEEIPLRFTRRSAAALGLRSLLESASVGSRPAEQARQSLLLAVDRCPNRVSAA